MSNFIYSANCCCSIGDRDNEVLSVSKEIAFIRQDTGEEVDLGFGDMQNVPDGTTLVKTTKWNLRKNYQIVARFDTEADAQAELTRIVYELSKSNLVIQVEEA